MNIINPSAEVWIQGKGITGLYEFIEKCSRICYRSQNNGKVTAEQFVKNVIIKPKHLRCCEFGTVVLPSPKNIFKKIHWHLRAIFNPWVEYFPEDNYFVTNLRYIIERYPDTWENVIKDMVEDCEPSKYRQTIMWHASRATNDSFRTHIGLSTLGESTRYCNYNKLGVETACPRWFKNFEMPNYAKAKEIYTNTIEMISDNYNKLLELGLKPEQARGILHLDIGSRFVQCGFKSAWDNFFEQRRSVRAHEDARYIAVMAKNLLDTQYFNAIQNN